MKEKERETTLQLLISMHHLDPRTEFSDRFSFRGLHGGSRYPGAIFNHLAFVDSHVRGGREKMREKFLESLIQNAEKLLN